MTCVGSILNFEMSKTWLLAKECGRASLPSRAKIASLQGYQGFREWPHGQPATKAALNVPSST